MVHEGLLSVIERQDEEQSSVAIIKQAEATIDADINADIDVDIEADIVADIVAESGDQPPLDAIKERTFSSLVRKNS